jgi:acetylornithine deacetylase
MRNTMIFLSLATLCGLAIASASRSHPSNSDIQRPLNNAIDPSNLDSIISKSPLLSFHRNIVEIESISDDENAVGKYIAHYLRAHKFTVATQEVPHTTSTDQAHSHKKKKKQKPRFNVLAYPPGFPSNKSHIPTLLSSHIDTVPPFIPYSLSPNPTAPSNPTISGRGTVDAKACVAAQTHALLSLLSSPHSHASTHSALLFVVGEETLGDGMDAVNDLNLTFDTVIFGEPTESKLATGHKGILGFTVSAHGKAAHSGYPWLGLSANSLLVKALSALEALTSTPEKQGGLPASEKYGNSTLNIGLMSGGVAANVIASSASARIAVRLAGGTPEKARSVINETLRAIDPENLSVQFWGPGYGPVDIDSDVKGFETITVNYGTDIPNLKYDGSYKRFLYGPGSILVAHGDNEALTVEDLEGAVEGYKRLVLASFKYGSRPLEVVDG